MLRHTECAYYSFLITEFSLLVGQLNLPLFQRIGFPYNNYCTEDNQMNRLFVIAIGSSFVFGVVSLADAGNRRCAPQRIQQTTCCKPLLSYIDALKRADDAEKAELALKQMQQELLLVKAELQKSRAAHEKAIVLSKANAEEAARQKERAESALLVAADEKTKSLEALAAERNACAAAQKALAQAKDENTKVTTQLKVVTEKAKQEAIAATKAADSTNEQLASVKKQLAEANAATAKLQEESKRARDAAKKAADAAKAALDKAKQAAKTEKKPKVEDDGKAADAKDADDKKSADDEEKRAADSNDK